ncbi:phosphotransferase [Pseudodesulfovibrio sp. JC047]|uniref:phosphotransferase n=1 Tax=Pseudodesulfovibrio sp. JC047 TaxID=2683199 RepID=UPI0013D069B0|nr:phosphotransferase [Pseudodesulfovibrio sp. JC047]NDV20231.1 phosphotransferase [Pseudodesulfovibrio sp. JC047]
MSHVCSGVDERGGISGSSIEFLGRTVRKTARSGGEEKLLAQAEHMKRLAQKLPGHVLKPIKTDSCGYSMEYFPGISLDVFCTMCSPYAAFQRLSEIVTLMHDNLYAKHNESYDIYAYFDYLNKRLESYGRLAGGASELNARLQDLRACLNGKTALEHCRAGLVHGDLTFENILLTADSFVLIDSNPSPSYFAPWALDVGKIRQSVFSFYERSKYSGAQSREALEKVYLYIGERFSRLFPVWSEALDQQSRFFEISHYIRLLDYKYRTSPKLSKYYYDLSLRLTDELVRSMRVAS